jgi:TolB-like protein/DNA-binding winged helix-turn-helix (wHTH) protein/Tfp pilus assembly protein PilF
MGAAQPSREKVGFDAFVLDLRAGELRKHGIRIKLQDQPFHILEILLEHTGEVVTRDELQRRLWPADTFVDFEHGLYNAIQRLREALGDSAETPRYIETLSKRGYRFIAPVTNGNRDEAKVEKVSTGALASDVSDRSAPHRRLRIPVLVAAGLAVVVLLLALAFKGGSWRKRLFGKAAVPAIRSLAVLPLQNLSNDINQEYFADGMTDALITDLAQVGSLKVISRTSTMRYKKSDKTLPEIARELNVDGIVEGTVQRSGDRVRISAQLIHGPSDKHLWAKSYERDARNVLSMESEIAEAIANQIQTRLTPAQEARLASTRPVNMKAFEAYLQGNYHVALARDVEYRNGQQAIMRSELEVARDFFEKAISEDPNYAPAFFGLSRIWRDRPATEGAPEKERAALEKALQLDPALAEAHIAFGELEYSRFWNWANSEREFKRAIELNPNLAEAHFAFTDYLDSMGRFDEGMKEYLRGQELAPGASPPMASPYFVRRDFDKAIEMDRNDIERHAFGFAPHWDLAQNYAAKGMHNEAVKEWEIAVRMLGYEHMADAMHRGLKAEGYKGALEAWARGLEVARAKGSRIPSFVLANAYTCLGDRDHAFAWLEIAYKERDGALQGLKVDPNWDNLRSDPRFQDLLRRMNFPE